MDNGRYVPVGVYCGDDRWLPDGIWYYNCSMFL